MNKLITKKKIIPIFFATDDNYFPYLSVALRSLIDNANRSYTYNIHILNNGVCEENKEILAGYNEKGFNIELADVSSKMTNLSDDLDTRDYYTKSIYYRLFIQSMFPEYNKVLYLDADIVVNGDISKLYNTNLGDCILGAVPDQFVGSTKEYQDYSRIVLGLDYKKYFNSGILVMDLKKMRTNFIENEFVSIIKAHHFATIAPDQDYLNFLVRNKVKYIDVSWNKEPLEDGYTGELNLIHYALFKKPWTYFDMKNDSYFWKYAIKTPFYDMLMSKRANYSAAQRENDVQADINLRHRANHICTLKHTFYNVLVKNKQEMESDGILDFGDLFMDSPATV